MTRFPIGTSTVAFLLSALLCVPPLLGQDPEDVQRPYPEGLYAELATSKGIIVLELDFRRTPMTVASFVGLAEGTIRNAAFPLGAPFFDGSVFHRVAPGHVIQAGRPASAQARSPGYTIPNEIHPDLNHRRMGILGMANGGPHTGSSQFYITLGDRSYLDGDYTVFGEVFGEMEVVLSVERGDTIRSVRIVRVGEEADAFRPDTESFREMVREVEARAKAAEEEKKAADLAVVEEKWPNAVTCTMGWRYDIVQEGTGPFPEVGDTLFVRYAGWTFPMGYGDHLEPPLQFGSTRRGGAPHFLPEDVEKRAEGSRPGAAAGEPFSFIVGEANVNPGFDDAVSQMRWGEKRIVIVPAEVGYDPVGFYGATDARRGRFVIRPFSMLVYEVEVMR